VQPQYRNGISRKGRKGAKEWFLRQLSKTTASLSVTLRECFALCGSFRFLELSVFPPEWQRIAAIQERFAQLLIGNLHPGRQVVGFLGHPGSSCLAGNAGGMKEISRWCQPPVKCVPSNSTPAGAVENLPHSKRPRRSSASAGAGILGHLDRWLTPPANFRSPSGTKHELPYSTGFLGQEICPGRWKVEREFAGRRVDQHAAGVAMRTSRGSASGLRRTTAAWPARS